MRDHQQRPVPVGLDQPAEQGICCVGVAADGTGWLAQLAEMSFPAGSMGRKIEACRRFVTATGRPAAIGALADAAAILAGVAGTTVTP